MLKIGDNSWPIEPAKQTSLLTTRFSQKSPKSTHYPTFILVLLLLLGIAAAWQWTPLSEWVDVETLKNATTQFKNHEAAPFLVIGTYLVAGLLIIPIKLLLVVTVLVFGPLYGFMYSWAGAILSALLTYEFGYLLGRHTVRQLAGARLNRISRRLAQQGVFTIFTIRLLPTAPFTLVNLAAGASHIRFRDFVLGTVLGITVEVLAIALIVEHVRAAVREPAPLTFALLTAVTITIGVITLGLGQWLRKH